MSHNPSLVITAQLLFTVESNVYLFNSLKKQSQCNTLILVQRRPCVLFKQKHVDKKLINISKNENGSSGVGASLSTRG